MRLRLTCLIAAPNDTLPRLGGVLLGLVVVLGCSKVQRDFGPLGSNGGEGGAAGASAGGGSPASGAGPGGAGTGGGGGSPNTNCGAWAGKLGVAGAAGSSTGQAGNGAAGMGGIGGEPSGACALASCTNIGTPLLTLSSVDQVNSFALSCGNGTAPDVAVLWTAPASGWYHFSTIGSSFDTVLALREPGCNGRELACGNDSGTGPESEVFRSLTPGETVLVVIDGNYGDRGTAVLNVEPVTCPTTDLTGQPLPANLTTVGGTNHHLGSCGGDGQLEKSYLWIPPSDGLYRFSATSSAMAAALYLERGPQCGGELLGCNAATGDLAATVTRWLAGGQPVTVIVDTASGSGPFTLNAEKLGDACPAITSGVPDGDIVLDSTAPDVLSPSCVPAPASQWMGPTHEHTYALGAVNCGISVRGDGPFAVYLLAGSRCDGPEVSCQSATCANGTCNASLSTGGYESVLVIEQATVAPLTYSVQFMCTMT